MKVIVIRDNRRFKNAIVKCFAVDDDFPGVSQMAKALTHERGYSIDFFTPQQMSSTGCISERVLREAIDDWENQGHAIHDEKEQG